MIQLKLKTEYSFKETYAPIPSMIKELKEMGCTAAGIVDTGTWGHVAWFTECKKAGIQPLLGVETVVSDGDIALRMWFLAKNEVGLSELYQYSSKGYQQLLKTKRGSIPRLYKADVANMSNNIFKFAGDITDAKWLKDINAILDLNPASKILNNRKRGIAEDLMLPLVFTSDNAYIKKSDVNIFELLAGSKVTPQHIIEDFGNEFGAIEKAIAKECRNLKLPKAPMVTAEGNLRALCEAGIKYRKISWTSEYQKRLEYELDLISSKNYDSYFIIVADMVDYAKKHMLVGPSRGSAAGSLVCYLTRITEVDPIPPGLFFERFIDITRIDLPDIDLDFPDKKRHMIFEYMSDKYGINNTAHIGTISRYKPRSALIKICKALNIPPQATAPVKTAMIERSSADARASNCLEDTLKTTSVGKDFIAAYPNAMLATKLEGHASHTGVHAAGLLICNDEITKYATVDNKGIAHVEKKSAETVGLLKIDVLGLRTLGVLEDSGVDIPWYDLKFDDPKVFDVFNKGLLCGIFQFDGQAMRSIAKLIEINSIVEIDAITALARPGPFRGGVTRKYIARKNGAKYTSIHPLVEKQMDQTFGLPIYQEQTLQICRVIGGFDWEGISIIRKAMSKSYGVEFFKQYKELFIKGAAKRGINEKLAVKTWELINAMGAWQMNKAHTYSYAVISYWTAYLKAHYPFEFAAANLRNAKDEDHAIMLLRELDLEGIKYVPFDIKLSEINWSVKNEKIIGGFTALKGIGEKKALKLIEDRRKGLLTEKQLDTLAKSVNPFDNIFPFHTLYQDYYDNPQKKRIDKKTGKEWRITSDLSEICNINTEGDVPHKHERIFMGELIHKNARNANEDVNIKKRKGLIATGQLEYVDVRLRDDHGTIGGRVDRWKFDKIGRKLLEEVPLGSHLIIKAVFYHRIPWAFISNWRRVDGEVM